MRSCPPCGRLPDVLYGCRARKAIHDLPRLHFVAPSLKTDSSSIRTLISGWRRNPGCPTWLCGCSLRQSRHAAITAAECTSNREGQSTVICSAVSADVLHWAYEQGVRMQGFDGVGGPRYVPLPDGRSRLYFFALEFGHGGISGGRRIGQSVISAVSSDGLNWERVGCAIDDRGYDSRKTDAVHAEDMPLVRIGDGAYRMYYAACDNTGTWQIASAVTDQQT